MPRSRKNTREYNLLDHTFDQLWPLTRSITGPGLEQSIEILSQHIPLELEKVPTGSQVYDWVVPEEWHLQRGILTGPQGEIVCDTRDSNLHIVNYSMPVNQTLTLEELQPHLHSLPQQPTAIPYVTSYYKRTWGFCLSHEVRKNLRPGNYKVLIDSEFKEGGVPFAHCLLPGDSSKEILLTSYLCHPSLANNELSGPLVLLSLFNRLSSWKRRRYSYRFLLNPETIGSLCFLSRYGQHLKQCLVSGLILTCVGGPSQSLRYKASQPGNSVLDLVAKNLANRSLDIGLPVKSEPFTAINGSDERQYGSPGFRLPVGQIARTPYGKFDGYHNSLDTKQFMGIHHLVETADALENMLHLGEVCGYPINLSPYGEPQLGPRGLYPNLNSEQTRTHSDDCISDDRTQLNRILTILSMSDGTNTLFDIARTCQCDVTALIPIIETLENNQLLAYGREASTL